MSVAVNVACALTLFPRLAEAGIAAAEATAGWVNATLLFLVLMRRGHFALDARLKRHLPRLVLAAALMGGALFGGKMLLADAFRPAAGLDMQALALAGLVLGGGLVYLAAAQAIGAADMRALARNMRRRPPGAPE